MVDSADGEVYTGHMKVETRKFPKNSQTRYRYNADRLDLAKQVFGTTGITDTIDAAIEEGIRRDRIERLIKRLSTMEGLDFDSIDVRHEAW